MDDFKPYSPTACCSLILNLLANQKSLFQSVIQLINDTSQSFREGKKWTCNSTCGTRSPRRKPTFRDRLASTRSCRCKRVCSQCDTQLSLEEDSIMSQERMLRHSKTLDQNPSSNQSRRQLVRQMAMTAESSDCSSKRLRVSGRMPSRQWTTDASFSEQQELELEMDTEQVKAVSSPMVMSSNSNAFLLRPVSRNSAGSAKLSTSGKIIDRHQTL